MLSCELAVRPCGQVELQRNNAKNKNQHNQICIQIYMDLDLDSARMQ